MSSSELDVPIGKLGPEASLLGAGRVVLEDHFEIPALKLPRFKVESVKVPRRRAAPTPSLH